MAARVGCGEFVYEVDLDWAKLPEGGTSTRWPTWSPIGRTASTS